MTSNHFSDQDIDKLHQPIGGATGKGCLTRCNGQNRGREEGNLCSHTWQAYEKAKDHPKMYNYPAYKSLCGDGVFKTGARTSKKGNEYPPNYVIPGRFPNKEKPKPGQWDIGIERNFQHFLKPWWHNAHHIIPNSTLGKAIQDVSKSNKSLANLIKGGLLMGEYNLNDKVNMIILPMGKEVANSIGLPRHLRGHQAEDGHSSQCFNHPDYNKKVRIAVNDAMNQFASIASKALEDHPEAPKKLTADKLDLISEKIFKIMRKNGPKMEGRPVDDMEIQL